MVRQFCFACMFLGFAFHPLTGCGASSNSSGIRASQRFGPGDVTPEIVNAMTLAFGDDHFMRILETAETLHNLDAAGRRWRTLEPLQAAAYLYVPRNDGPDARTLCLRDKITISDFRHYWEDASGFHVEKCFA